MKYPAFFDEVPSIATFDGLAQLLGATPDGRIEYTYADAVRLAGHSCPTVAGAYLMTMKGLQALYPDTLPERGAIHVSFQEDGAEGTTGVVANVIGLITGACGDGGFKGLGGRFHRNGLLHFNAPIGGEVRFSTGDRAVDVTYQAQVVPFPPGAQGIFAAALQPNARPEALAAFAGAFQERVRRILVEHRDDADLVVVKRV